MLIFAALENILTVTMSYKLANLNSEEMRLARQFYSKSQTYNNYASCVLSIESKSVLLCQSQIQTRIDGNSSRGQEICLDFRLHESIFDNI